MNRAGTVSAVVGGGRYRVGFGAGGAGGSGRMMNDDDRFDDFMASIQAHFDAVVSKSPVLFETDAGGLWDLYLENAPPEFRQSRTCNCCRQFIQRFGHLVTISESGEVTPAIWPEHVLPQYADAVSEIRRRVKHARVAGVFRAKEGVWGTPTTGPWNHLALLVPTYLRSTSRIKTPHQESAEKLEEFGMLKRALEDFGIETVRQANALLTSDALYRSEKAEGVARWFLDVHEKIAATPNRRAQMNIAWLAVAKAPPGYAHVRSTMLGTLLEDIVAGLPFETVKRRWAEKMHPLQYMRPQAPPSAGNVAQAEKIIDKLAAEGSLRRRFAKLSDVQALWLPRPLPSRFDAARTGRTSSAHPNLVAKPVFGHLVKPARQPDPIVSKAPPTTMTWSKFASSVLPDAEQIEYLVPTDSQAYTAMITAANPDAPNLLQWDNPVTHYVYSSGSLPHQWNLRSGVWHRVTAVVLRPWMWDPAKTFAHQGAGVLFALEGAKDITYRKSGGMFVEMMKSEFHGIRRTLEAYFNGAIIEGQHEAEVCGVSLVQNSPFWGLSFRVTSCGVMRTYKLDRWD